MVNLSKLGGVIFAALVSYYALLETTCINTDPYEGAGELVITRGGSAKGTRTGSRFPAPLLTNAGEKVPANGTADAALLWIEDLCDAVLDCSVCPVALRSDFNVSALRGCFVPPGREKNLSSVDTTGLDERSVVRGWLVWASQT